MKDKIRHLMSRSPRGESLLEVWRELRVITNTTFGSPHGLGLPFNGQVARMRTVRALLNTFSPDAVVETGTFLGDTTRFFSGNLIPVYSIEVKRLFFLAAKWRLRGNRDVKLVHGDSRDVLGKLARHPPFERPLVYLDAHWWHHLPLRSEVSQILVGWDESITLIDDFQVPEDPGYGFDTHDGIPLALDYLELPVSTLCAFPATPSHQESGGKRGALYIANGPSARHAISHLADQGLLAIVGG